MNQVAKNEELLNIAKDCFQFVTNFFEVINISVAHIYHSALELCPTLSIIRELYYHRRIVRSPVVIGTPESWPQTIAISGKDQYYGLCAWSPCGRFVAAQTWETVEIRNQLTLELITTLQPAETIPHLAGPLAYSPDGRSIACASDTAIIIWDIQTGGVAKEVECGPGHISLVWSSDGRTLCTIDQEGLSKVGDTKQLKVQQDQMTFIVHIYDISSGTALSPSTLQSGNNPHLWTHDEYFWVMTTVRHIYRDNTIEIFRVGSTLAKIHSFSFPSLSIARIGTFSPATRRISILTDKTLRISDIRNSKCLLDTAGHFLSHCFSSDGSLFAASKESGVHIWKYTSVDYTPWKEFRCRGLSNSPLQFSPTPSSLLGYSGDILQVLRLHEFSTALQRHRQQYMGLSRSGARVATARKLENTVTIIDLAQASSQFIDTDVAIEGLIITGNVLLVAGSGQLVAWLLTEEGLVDGVVGDRRVGRSDSIWTIPLPLPCGDSWTFSVEGQVGVIKPKGNALHAYHTKTGKVFHPTQAPRHPSGGWYHFTEALCGRDYFRYHNLSKRNPPPEESWQISPATLREGWVKDPEGKHRLWVSVEWRTDWDPVDWRHDITTQFSYLGGRSVLIKF